MRNSLQKGSYRVGGPEPAADCCNTGHRAAVYHLTDRQGGGYLVGPEIDIVWDWTGTVLAWSSKGRPASFKTGGNRVVRYRKTSRSAMQVFENMKMRNLEAYNKSVGVAA